MTIVITWKLTLYKHQIFLSSLSSFYPLPPIPLHYKIFRIFAIPLQWVKVNQKDKKNNESCS